MPGPLDQLPPDATTLARRVQALERLVRELMASRRGSNATVGGGNTTITGARIQTASEGARAVLDSVEGALMVYDEDNNLTNYVGGPGDVIFNQTGFPVGEWVAFAAGNLLLGVGNAADLDQSKCGVIGIDGTGFGVGHESPANATFTEKAFLELLAGTAAGTPGTVDYPTLQVQGDLGVTSAAVKLSPTFDTTAWRWTPEAWQTPTWAPNWSGTNTLGSMGGFRSLQAHHMTQDDVWVLGAATTTGTSGTIGTLPASMWPPTGSRVLLPAYFNKAGTISSGMVQVTEAGVINSSPSLGGIIPASGTQVFINGHYPLANTP